MTMPRCPQCGHATDSTDNYCRECGHRLKALSGEAMKYETRMVPVFTTIGEASDSDKKLDARFEKAIADMSSQGWELVGNSRFGSGSGTLTFRRPVA
jgi:uncharacterized OB-fold protein